MYRYLIAASMVGFSYFGFVSVLLNLYLLRLGYGTDFIGMVNGSTALAFALSSLPAGAIGSRFGMRRGATGGMCFLAAGVMLVPTMALLPVGVPPRDVGIIAMRVLSGIGFSLYMVNSYPYLVAATDARDRPYAFAMLAAIPPVAGFAGSVVSGALPVWVANGLGLDTAHPLPFAVVLVFRRRDPAAHPMDRGPHPRPGAAEAAPQRQTYAGAPPARYAAPTAPLYVLIFFLGITALLRMAGEGAARSFFKRLPGTGPGRFDIAYWPAAGVRTTGGRSGGIVRPGAGQPCGQDAGNRRHYRDHRREPGDHGAGAALGGCGHRFHAGGGHAFDHPVGLPA